MLLSRRMLLLEDSNEKSEELLSVIRLDDCFLGKYVITQRDQAKFGLSLLIS